MAERYRVLKGISFVPAGTKVEGLNAAQRAASERRLEPGEFVSSDELPPNAAIKDLVAIGALAEASEEDVDVPKRKGRGREERGKE